VTSETSAAPTPRAAAAGRILEATSRCIMARGAADVSLQDVAEAAGVSKALIHYHFRDKGELLARLVEWLRAGVVARQDAALSGVTSAAALDALWAWLADELARGDLRVLLDLSLVQGESVQAATSATAQARRESAAALVAQLHDLLGLKPRVPAAMIAETFTAFVDGIALDGVVSPARNPRVAFDVFWLAILGLAD
jgi:AcrR family transcriptional regulator